MPQIKPRGKHFVGDMRTRTRLTHVGQADARRNLIAECLRDLAGIELIYAIRLPDGIIKIGHTRNLKERRKQLDTTPEAILAVRPGTYAEEQALHHTLSPHVAHGREYYHPTPEVLAFVNGVRETLGVDPIAA